MQSNTAATCPKCKTACPITYNGYEVRIVDHQPFCGIIAKKDAEIAALQAENTRLAAEWQQTHDWNNTLVSEHYALQARIKELTELYDEYLAFLYEANRGPVGMAYVHGWRCPDEDVKKGQEYRDRIASLKEKVYD